MKEQLLKLQEVFTKAKGERVELGLVDDLNSLKKQFYNKVEPVFKEITKDKQELMQKGKKTEATLNSIED